MNNFDEIQKAVSEGSVYWQYHAAQMLIERGIASSDVLGVLMSGKVIENYRSDKPYPSLLVFGWISKRPIHVICSFNDVMKLVHIITVYEPDLQHFEEDFITRRLKHDI